MNFDRIVLCVCLAVAFGPWLANLAGEIIGVMVAAIREELKP